MPEKRIQLKTCTLVIRDGVNPVDMLINADRILRGLPALTKEKQRAFTPLQPEGVDQVVSGSSSALAIASI